MWCSERSSRSTRSNHFNVSVVLLIALLILPAACVILTSGCKDEEKTLTIKEVRLDEEDLKGYTLKEELYATRENAAPKSIVKELYDAGALKILNQSWEKDGRKLQINYVEMKDRQDGRHAEAMLEAAVGGANYIGSKDNIAIEIIGNDEDTGQAAAALSLSL